MQKMLTRILTRQWLVELFFYKILDLAIEEVGVREVAVSIHKLGIFPKFKLYIQCVYCMLNRGTLNKTVIVSRTNLNFLDTKIPRNFWLWEEKYQDTFGCMRKKTKTFQLCEENTTTLWLYCMRKNAKNFFGFGWKNTKTLLAV